jgi:Protein of unknown function (DUF3124)
MLKVIVVLLSILALPSCQSRQADSQDVAQPSPTRVEPNRPTEGNENLIIGQTIYVPIYSHIYIRDKTRVINLTATLSIRNTDAQNPISITSVRYYNTVGSHVRDYIKEPLRLAPMASTDFVVAEDDTSGGAGANFIVEWGAGSEVTVPVVEAVMISTASQQGISFVSTGRVIKERLPQSSGK